MPIFLQIWSLLAALLYVVMALLGLYRTGQCTRFEDTTPPEPTAWPELTVIIPACDEAATLEAACASVRAQDYPKLQILLVDDRSRDGTGAIIDRIAAEDRRVTPLHIETLPPGWLGKVHALHVAAGLARGEWLLFTDADVHFAPGLLRRSVAWALHRELDHLSLLPKTTSRTLAGDIGVAVFGSLFLLASGAQDVGKPGSTAVAAVGAFNLVKAATLRRTAGFQWLALEIADDLGLATLLQKAGARSRFAIATESLRIEWYANLGEMARGLEKNAFAAVGRFSWPRSLLLAVVMAAMPLGLVAGLLCGPDPVRAAALLAWAVSAMGNRAVARRFGQPEMPALFLPFGHVALAWILLRSAWRTTRQGGIVWRGTLYPTAALRAGQRIEL